MQRLRKYEVPTYQKNSTFVWELDVAHPKARIEHVATEVQRSPRYGAHGIVWVRDFEAMEYSKDPETGLETPKTEHRIRVVCIPLFNAHDFEISAHCAEMLGAFRDDNSEWMVFLLRRPGVAQSASPAEGSKAPAQPSSATPDAHSKPSGRKPGP